ncbi:MAG: amidohydrolase family protein [Armatimonadota bacterium]|nr:amidohydrolase family protein [Armatimonadota bacterium]
MHMLIDIHRHYHRVEGELEEYMQRARSIGVEKVGMSTCGPLFNQYDNEGVVRAREQYPGMIISFGYVKLGIDGVEKVDHLHTLGFEALKMIVPTVPYDDRSLLPIYERAEALGMPCNIHCGILGRLRNERGHDIACRRMRPVCLDMALRSCPDLKVLMPHLGQPWYDEAWMMIATYENLFWDLSSVCLKRSTEFLADLFLSLGEEVWESASRRLCYASDTSDPVMMRDRYEEILDAMGADDDLRQSVYRGAAERLMS